MNTLSSTHKVVAFEPGRGTGIDTPLACELGKELELKYEILQEFSGEALKAEDIDLLMLAGLVAFADRNVRRPSGSLTRELHLLLPVYALDIWRNDALVESLRRALNFLTGDTWHFNFQHRRAKDERAFQLKLKRLPDGEGKVLPYSGGLDSFAEHQLFASRYPAHFPILVTALHSSAVYKPLKASGCADYRPGDQVKVPVRFDTWKNPEQSYRSRVFLFFVVASLSAKLSRAQEVLIPENGQGSLGPSLVPCGREHPMRSTHPGFTRRLEGFLSHLWGNATPAFRHPNLWVTKSELIAEMSAINCDKGWKETRSCGRSMRNKGKGLPAHCGICGNCLLRRLSLKGLVAQLGQPDEQYYWQDLNASSLEEAIPSGTGIVSDNDRRIAAAAVTDLTALASLKHSPLAERVMSRAVAELESCGRGIGSAIEARLRRLLSKHSEEWLSFVGDLKHHSWLVRLAEAGS
jgi:7-cyano-7-deazaguanine synthase in queuosine biosynthesis